MLRRVFVLHGPFDAPRSVRVVKSLLVFPPSNVTSFGCALVDEAHHLVVDDAARVALEQFALGVQCVYLSDRSQSHGDETIIPGNPTTVRLDEVVRCSQRIMQAGRIFELGGASGDAATTTETAATTARSHLDTVGPPLQSVLFDARQPDDGTLDDILSQYAEHTRETIERVRGDYPGLRLHNRLAIVVPDEPFLERFLPALSALLPSRFKLVDAVTASSVFVSGEHIDDKEWIMCDTMSNLDGLERLIVFAVGLDAPIDGGRERATRSLLYRAVTRAHMLAALINVRVPRGWLEWLTRVKLDEKAFDPDEELARADGGGGVFVSLSARSAGTVRATLCMYQSFSARCRARRSSASTSGRRGVLC